MGVWLDGMVDFPDERRTVLAVRSRLDDWTTGARAEAYAELFGGEASALTAEELRTLDAVDSANERGGGDGIWGADRYGVHTGAPGGADGSIGIVCVHHPQITDDTVPDGGAVDGVDDETRERLNAALWRYSERVATLIGEELDTYLDR